MTNSSHILERIAAHNRLLVEKAKAKLPLELLQSEALELLSSEAADQTQFEAALAQPGLSFICELKQASPSKGLIARSYPYLKIAKEYEQAGADAISCLSEPKWFLGSLEHLKNVAATVKTPVLRKDFIVDEYQIYEAKCAGASAVLLLCNILSDRTIAHFMELSARLGMSALVEAYTEDELRRAVSLGARIIGVNNRNLKDFSVDFSHAQKLRALVPDDRIFVSESGISCLSDIQQLVEMRADAVLIGEFLMRAKDKTATIQEMRAVAGKALQ